MTLICDSSFKSFHLDPDNWNEVMKCLCAYKSIDITNNEKVNKANYYLILWLFNEVEPEDSHIKVDLSSLDLDKNGSISLFEWITFFTLKGKEGDVQFRGYFKRKFLEFDKDGSGAIDKAETGKIIQEGIKDWLRHEQAINDLEGYLENIKEKISDITDKIYIQIERESGTIIFCCC